MSFEFGDVVLVRFPFTNQRDAKKRPAVVVSSSRYQDSRPDVVILALTSRVPTAPDFGVHVLSGWRQAGSSSPPR
ncbi:MAG: type II toxin-antitoxin system PemK/MazF family toxin [Myxococcota bacterium]